MTEPASRPPDAAAGAELRQRYWRLNLRLTAALMLLWFGVSFVLTFFARELSFSFFGWPFSYWVGAQGAILVYLAIIALYAQVMNRLDRTHGFVEDDE
jgi:putative solute:sodium symporter small subunit